jgi:hypothetical protein
MQKTLAKVNDAGDDGRIVVLCATKIIAGPKPMNDL